jgi:O-antigen/teichoic acid export membrane protein
LSFVTLLFILFTKPALAVLVSSDFQKAATYVPWIAAAYVIRAVASQFRCIFVLEGQTKNELWVALIGGGVCLAGYAFLIPRFHLWGAVASTLLGFSLMLVFALHLGQRIRHFDFEYRRIGIVLAVTFALALPVWIFHPHQWLAQIALGCVLASAYPAALRAAGFFYPSELAALKTQLSLVRARLANWRSQPEAEPVAAGVAE